MKNFNKNSSKSAFCLLLLTSIKIHSAAPPEKPNILLIISDDLRTELNCYGVSYIKSPNIDQLANESTLFKNAYCQQAVCAASRASFLSGCRPNTTGVDYPYSEYYINTFWPAHPTIAEYFERQGYVVRTFGKVHHGPKYDKIINKHFDPEGIKFYALEENIVLGGKIGRSKQSPPFESADVPDESYSDGLIAQEVVKTINSLSGNKNPFMLIVGFKKPHLPFCAPKNYWDLYNEDEIGLAPYRKHPLNSPEYSTIKNNELAGYAGYTGRTGDEMPEYYQKKLRHGYAACVSFIDAQVGKLIEELKRSGKYENTIIILMSDHGWHLGDQNMWGKSTNFENATHSPLIIRVPGKTKGDRLSQIVEYVDIYPTLVELAGLKPAGYLEGTSIVPLLDNPERNWKKAAFSQYPRGNFEGYSIRTKDFRYVEWRSNENDSVLSRELYDHRTDPLETTNLADIPNYKSLVNEMSMQLKKGWKAALPEGIRSFANNKPAPLSVPWKGEL